MNRPISVLLADDHALVLRMLRDRLNGEEDITVVAAVANASEAVAEAIRLKPQVVVMDIDMPGMTCFEGARTIHAACPGTRTMFLSSFSNDAYIDQALAVEAAGYLTKSEPPEEVIDAIRAVVAGHRRFSAEVESRILVEEDGLRLAKKRRSRASTLSPRELEVLRYIARGMSQEEIARTVHRSAKTIHTHAIKIMKKLGIHDRVELARFAIREGLAEA